MNNNETTINRILEPRPDGIPAGWLIFNAPRHMWGTIQWQGQGYHGVFYAAVEPTEKYAKDMIETNCEMDGWITEYITMKDILTGVEQVCLAYGYKLEAMERLNERQLIDQYCASKLNRCKATITRNEEGEWLVTPVKQDSSDPDLG
ncbi:MAG: hypothetical protein MOB07_31065 [Acidobacteria bacterium]|nr:hypothetical protein [Acidobacteriota bacterium]